MDDNLPAGKRIAIVGGGPSALFMFKRLAESKDKKLSITIFERRNQIGAGMPYSVCGANDEHVTNVSDNEIPEIVISVEEWVKSLPQETLGRLNIDPKKFNEYKVLPRLLFGQYLEAQFYMLFKTAEQNGIDAKLRLNTEVTDITDHPGFNKTSVETSGVEIETFDSVIICTGHYWPRSYENSVPRWFDSPYPPSKLQIKVNHPVAIKGSSLTAIDAIRTLARQHGHFNGANGKTTYQLSQDFPDFRLVMHSRSGLLPAIRFHLDDSHLSKDSVLSAEAISQTREKNNGFLPLDYVFEQNFKKPVAEHDPEFYETIKDFSIEEFVAHFMELRERLEPFQLFRAEYTEAEQSIRRHESVYWKEMLAVLSFAMNYPAKYFSAEDMLRLRKVLMPLISIVIAFVPQSSSEELIALHNSGVLDIIPVGNDSRVEPHENGGAVYHYSGDGIRQHEYFGTFVDCVGQPHLSVDDFPFNGLKKSGTVSAAKIKFQSAEAGHKALAAGNKDVEPDPHGNYYLRVPGIAINDNFNVVDNYGAYNERVYIMAVPYIGGFNPDYSGLDFCEAASARIIESLVL